MPLAVVLTTIVAPARAAEPVTSPGAKHEPLVVADEDFDRRGKPSLHSQDIEWQTFYEIAGSPALARSYLRRKRTIQGLRWTALILGPPGLGLLLGGIFEHYGPGYSETATAAREPPYIAVGLAMSATALGLLLASTTIRRHPVSPRRIHQMKDNYNQRMQAKPYVAPSVGLGSVGVAGRF